MRQWSVAVAWLGIWAICASVVGQAPPATPAHLTLEQIMADPDWLGNAPERPYWADDSKSFYYSRKKQGSEERELFQVGLDGTQIRVVSEADRPSADVPGGGISHDLNWKVYSRAGDLYLKDLRNGQVRQLTRTAEDEVGPAFLWGDDRIAFRRGGGLFVRTIADGFEFQPADLRAQDDPDKKKDDEGDLLRQQQRRLFDFIQERTRRADEAKEREKREREADSLRAPKPWYLGGDVEIRDSSLSPSGRWMLVRLVKKAGGGEADGKRDAMPQYVSESGYVESREVRSKVGTGKPRGEQLVLLDLDAHERHDLDLAVLPGITDDPLKNLREAAEARRKAEKEKKDAAKPGDAKPPATEPMADPAAPPAADPAQPTAAAADETAKESKDAKKDEKPRPRPVTVSDIEWSDDGSRVVVEASSLDSKDRWIAGVDLESKKLVPLERDTDEAWINGRFTGLGWLRADNTAIWFQSERTGYGHLYLRPIDPALPAKALTEGRFEVGNVAPSRDGRHLYYTANAAHPGVHETWRVDVSTLATEQLTRLGGAASSMLSPDGATLLVTHSRPTRPPELYIQPARPNGEAKQVTRTTSEAFLAIPWQEPEVVAIPSKHGVNPVYARVYTPPPPPAPPTAQPARLPAVVFIHGAGYLQNAHKGWSSYFREFMFHNLLVQRGYVVLDMDYRASAGYGRDWRTAIYRRMGTPEVEDLEDGVAWLAEHKNVDAARVGCYGGSYGGFLTLMALFTKPDLFACGAALRPVTDWAHYNHGYTANILNTPPDDPEAYDRSSPIEFASGLKRPLLICHGMQDDNVFFQDTVRLAQRLIELEKQDWEVAMYPVEAHGFQRPSSWLDEYRRILKLFERHLKPPADGL